MRLRFPVAERGSRGCREIIEMPSARRMWLHAGLIVVGTGAALTFKGWAADLSGFVGLGISMVLIGATIIVVLKLR